MLYLHLHLHLHLHLQVQRQGQYVLNCFLPLLLFYGEVMKSKIVQLLISLLLITNTWQNVALASSLPIVSSHHPMAIINSINNTDSATTTYRYNDLDQLTSVQNPHDWSAREQTYSQDGDLITAADGKEYTFNGQDQLVKVKLKSGKTINYQYYPDMFTVLNNAI